MAKSFRFRTALYKLLPAWLTRGDGEKVYGSMAYFVDMFVERAMQGLDAGFPSRAGASALRLIGVDRGIPRGRTETSTHYASRLRRWRYPRGHRTRGSAFALLEQISEYWGGMLCRTENVNQKRNQRTAAGVESTATGTGWSWDGDTSRRSRFWIVLFPNPDVPAIKAWGPLDGTCWGGDMTGGPDGSYTIGQQGVTPEDVDAMRRLLRTPVAWKPAGTSTDFAVIVLDDSGTDPAVAPAGAWGTILGRATAPNTFRFWRMR